MPWRDRSGRFSLLKATTFALLFAPGLALAYGAATHGLGARPINATIHTTGLWAIRLVLISLAVTPLRQVLHLPRLILVRRMLGVAAFAYAAFHLATFAADKMFDLAVVADEIVLRIYLTVGAGALLLLLALAATSTDGMVARLGARRWQALQRAVYVIGTLALVHFFMQSKLDLSEPTFMAGFFFWLMGYRLLAWRRGTAAATQPLPLLLLSLGAALATALGEALGYGLFTGVPGWRLLQADLDFAVGIRPAWIVLAAGVAMALAAALRERVARPLTRPARP